MVIVKKSINTDFDYASAALLDIVCMQRTVNMPACDGSDGKAEGPGFNPSPRQENLFLVACFGAFEICL